MSPLSSLTQLLDSFLSPISNFEDTSLNSFRDVPLRFAAGTTIQHVYLCYHRSFKGHRGEYSSYIL